MTRRLKRIYTAEAIMVGIAMALAIGVLVGVAAAIFVQSCTVGLIAGCCMFLCSIDVLFWGS